MSATYKQHQNAVAESLWAKLKPMTSINISSNPELGYHNGGTAPWYTPTIRHSTGHAKQISVQLLQWAAGLEPQSRQHTSNLGGHVGTCTNR
jgi:hypothetical protein